MHSFTYISALQGQASSTGDLERSWDAGSAPCAMYMAVMCCSPAQLQQWSVYNKTLTSCFALHSPDGCSSSTQRSKFLPAVALPAAAPMADSGVLSGTGTSCRWHWPARPGLFWILVDQSQCVAGRSLVKRFLSILCSNAEAP